MKNKSTIFFAQLLVFIGSYSTELLAGESESEEQGFATNITASYFYNDNVTSANINQISANIFLIRPDINWSWNTGNNVLNVNLGNETAKYEQSSEDNYSDTFLALSSNHTLYSRHRLSLNAEIADLHQSRGQGFDIGGSSNSDSVDTYSQTDFELRYSFGREEAMAQIELYLRNTKVDFDARFNSIDEDVTRIRDRVDTTHGILFSYELGARTDLIIDVNQQELEYDFETGFGNTLDSVLLGLRWEATAKTSGRILVGKQERELTLDSNVDDYGIWQVEIDWTPKTYSRFSLNTSKTSESSIGIGNTQETKVTTLGWYHDWNSRLQTSLDYTSTKTVFQGTNIDLDEDQINFNIVYMFNDSDSISIYYSDTRRESLGSESSLDYDQLIYGISYTLALF